MPGHSLPKAEAAAFCRQGPSQGQQALVVLSPQASLWLSLTSYSGRSVTQAKATALPSAATFELAAAGTM